MIFDSLKNIENYRGLGRVFEALEFLAKTDFHAMEIGRYELTEDIYYMIQEYETKPKTVAEVHEAYIDIQLLVEGREAIGVAPLSCEKELVEAKPEKDIWKYTCKTHLIPLKENDFMVLYPSDIHMPGTAIDESVKCRKVVVKVKV